jgi:hypothetical protein
MKKFTATVIASAVVALTSTPVFADSVINSFNCKLKDGKTIEDVHATNSKWLKWVRANVNEKIESSVGTAIVGDTDMFLFIDTYPDLNTWAATQTALDSDAADELDNMFDDVTDCSQNRLWKVQPTP